MIFSDDGSGMGGMHYHHGQNHQHWHEYHHSYYCQCHHRGDDHRQPLLLLPATTNATFTISAIMNNIYVVLYIYVYIYIYIYMYTRYMCVYMCAYIYIYIYIYIYVWVLFGRQVLSIRRWSSLVSFSVGATASKACCIIVVLMFIAMLSLYLIKYNKFKKIHLRPICVYIYIYTYIRIHVYIYIYIRNNINTII